LGQLATMTAGDNSPDVIQMDESYIAAYGARDALLDLGTVKDNLDLSAMDAKVLGTGKVGGRSSAPRSAWRTSQSESIPRC
jgi:multiple sugar transport system substrate-binding protein